MLHYFSNKLYEILIRHLLDEKKITIEMIQAAETDDVARRDIERIIVDEVYQIRRG